MLVLHRIRQLLDVLRLLNFHPRPRLYETYSCYLLRLARGNGFRSTATFLESISKTTRLRRSNDNWTLCHDFLPLEGFGRIPQLTGASEQELVATTLTHFLDNTLGHHEYKESRKWLKDSLLDHFRFCPVCLREYGYYFLTWRFKINEVCPEHAVVLVDKCHKCNAQLPLPLTVDNWENIFHCPFCRADLRESPARSLNAEEYRRGLQIQQNIEFLLKPGKAKMLRNDLGAVGVFLDRFLESDSAFLDWDAGLPEQQDFREFNKYYCGRWKSGIERSNNRLQSYIYPAINLLFTLYWMAPSIEEAASLFLKYREEDFYTILEHDMEKRPYLLKGGKYFSQATIRTVANSTLPSIYDFVPFDDRIHFFEEQVSDLSSILNRIRNILKEEPVRSLQAFDDIDLERQEWTKYVKAFDEKLWALEAQRLKSRSDRLVE